MIVITSLDRTPRFLAPGDSFNLCINDTTGFNIIISEKITKKIEINFVASFRFALENGICPGSHLTGIFANSDELPKEIENAVMFEDLTRKQRRNFRNSVGIKI